jgi:hypothetical protein
MGRFSSGRRTDSITPDLNKCRSGSMVELNADPDLESYRGTHKKKKKILRYKFFRGGIRKNPKIAIFDQISWNFFLINIFFLYETNLGFNPDPEFPKG